MSYQDVKRIHTEMSLREPLADALKALDKTLRDLDEYETPLSNTGGVASLTGKTFETAFPSFCFHIATGVGKTRLLGACIAYLYRTQNITDFFVLVPGSTIYNKFKGSDFVRGGPKFLLAGLEDFPDFNLITAENYRGVKQTGLFDAPLNIYLFNIGKIFEGRKGSASEFKFSKEDADGLGLEYPEGFASYLAERQPVILMDEAHRYYAPASLSAMNRLKPRLGLEFTATPTFKGNILSTFNLGQAIDAGYVKRPRVAKILNDNTPPEEKEQASLMDAARSHERKKAVLTAYCQNNGLPPVSPVLLVTTEDTGHGDRVAAYLEGKTEITIKEKDGTERKETLYKGVAFGTGTPLEGRYAGKVLLVHSKTEEDTDQAVKTLETNRYEIVVHVNKLKEGLDVSTIYTLAVLRAAKANVLTEQIIGRGLRLPFGQPVPEGADTDENVQDMNALDIMPHKEFEKVIAEAEEYLKGKIDEKEIDRKKPEAAAYDTITVSPSGDPALQITIPLIDAEVVDEGKKLAVFPIKPGIDPAGDDDYKRALEITDLRTRNRVIIEVLDPQGVTDGVAYLVAAANDRLPGIDGDDFPVLAELARDYLTQLRPDASTWPYAIALRKEPILADFTGLVKSQLEGLRPTVQVRREGTFQFKPWTKSVAQGYVTPARQDRDPAQEKAGVLIGGYTRSLYDRNYFDSKQEKWLADCLENDKRVLRWVRLPTRQMRIGLSSSGYYPDFVAVVRDNDGLLRCYLLEVKAANKCDPARPDPDVLRKFLAAQDWVDKANGEEAKDGGDGSKWQYRLLTDKEVERRRGDDFLYMADGAAQLHA